MVSHMTNASSQNMMNHGWSVLLDSSMDKYVFALAAVLAVQLLVAVMRVFRGVLGKDAAYCANVDRLLVWVRLVLVLLILLVLWSTFSSFYLLLPVAGADLAPDGRLAAGLLWRAQVFLALSSVEVLLWILIETTVRLGR